MTTIKKTFLSALCTFVCALCVSSAIAQMAPYETGDEVCFRKSSNHGHGHDWVTCKVEHIEEAGSVYNYLVDLKITEASKLSSFGAGAHSFDIIYDPAIFHGGPCQGYVEIYGDKDYHGTWTKVIYVEDVGANSIELGNLNDKMSSLIWKLQPNVTATIWAHNPPGGKHFNLTGNGGIPNCHPHHLNGSDWCGGDCASAVSFSTQ